MGALDNYPSERGYSDRYTVDRSRLETMSTVFASIPDVWCRIGGVRESKNHEIRMHTNMQEKLEAWRGIVALPGALKVGR